MAVIEIHAQIPKVSVSPVLRQYCEKLWHIDAEFKLTIPFDQLNMHIVDTYTEKIDYPLHFSTNDLKPQLDAMSNNFFSALYPDEVITGDIHFGTKPLFGFYLVATNPYHVRYIEDIFLSPEETNHLCSIAVEYASANGIHLPGQLLSWRERMGSELEEVLCAYADKIPSGVLSALLPFVREDVLDALEADEQQRQTDMVDGDLVVKYFWKALIDKISTKQ